MQSSRFRRAAKVNTQSKSNLRKPSGYWENKDNVILYLSQIKEKYKLETAKDWNTIHRGHFKSNGGLTLLKKYPMYELKCMACPEGKSSFTNPPGYWDNEENILQFLLKIQKKYNFNSPEDWNLLSTKQIKDNGGCTLLDKFSIFELKCLVCPEGKFIFNNPYKSPGYWEIKENVINFLYELKQKYNLNTPEEWNQITNKQILLHGGRTLLKKYSIYDLKCMACPEGKLIFDSKNQCKSPRYWEDKNNILEFLSKIKEIYNLNSLKDWNSITNKHIISNGGSSLLKKYSMFELKCMACPEGKLYFNNKPKPIGYWDHESNVLQFLYELKEKNSLHLPEDWNSITRKHILDNGGGTLLRKYSLYELKCMACPEGKLVFDAPKKSIGYWENRENILQFFIRLKKEFNLQSVSDWNLITTKNIQSIGGSGLLHKYSLYEIKCMACPEGKSTFTIPMKSHQIKSPEYWEDETNRNLFFEKLKQKYNLKTPNDWKRLSKSQIISQGGNWLFKDNIDHSNIKIKFESSNIENYPESLALNELISTDTQKKSSQRYLFLQIQKLFPGEEIVEDYFHSGISRDSGYAVQFDIFMIQRNIAIEYHGKQHFVDINYRFSSLEMYQNRDIEKAKLCRKYGIQLVVIPYWWDNNLDSLKETLRKKINM